MVKMNGMRRICAALVALLIGAGLASPAAGAAQPDLAGTTTVRGNSTTVMDVIVREDVTIPKRSFDNPAITIRSRGRFAGVVLKSLTGGAELISYNVATCEAPPCASPSLNYTYVTDARRSPTRNRALLPAGYYRLFLLADGTPTEVTMDLKGLTGRTTLRPKAEADYTLGPLETQIDNASSNVNAGTASHSFENPGISLVALAVEADQEVAASYSTCLSEESASEEPVHVGSCHGSVANLGEETSDRYSMVVGMGLVDAADWSHQVSYQLAGVVSSAHALEFSLDYGSGFRSAVSYTSIYRD